MEFLTSIVGAIGGEIAKCALVPVGRQIGYLIFYNGNVKKLEKEMKDLIEKKTMMEPRVVAAENSLHIRASELKTWQQKAGDIHGRATNFLEEEIKNRKCLNDLCPDPVSRYSLSRKATKMKEEILSLLEEAKEYCTIDLPNPPRRLGSTLNTEGFKEYGSRDSIMKKILEALRDDSSCMMSICGQGGVGKTTMVDKLVSTVEKDLCYEVAKAVVSQNPDVKTIQGDIASCLGLKFHDENEQERAQKLHERIIVKSEKKILVILDDVWTEEDFKRLGLPAVCKREGYKILLTSRKADECRKMNCLSFRVDALSKEEGWDLFKGTIFAGSSIDLPDIAEKIADECDGLPILIVAIAKALKGRDKYTWANALDQLKSGNLPDVNEGVYRKLELSYNFLRSDEAKACFLLCCLFPEDHDIPIEDLVWYAVGLRLLGHVETISEARNRVFALIGDLKESSLLLHGNKDKDEYVKMHDVFRAVALSIASRTKPYLVSCENKMKHWPNKWRDSYNNCAAISLFSENVEEHPIGLVCPKLELLQLRSSRALLNNFFDGMKELKVLDLHCGFPPGSLNAIENVRTLRLSNEESTSAILELKNVEILEIRRIKELPSGVGLLKYLRLLDLRNTYHHLLRLLNLRDTYHLKYIPAGVLSKLSKLEELYVSVHFWMWESRVDGEKTNASLIELESQPIRTLEIRVSEISHLPKRSILEN